MVDERRRVIADLLVRLSEAGIEPDSKWSATFLPGLGWAFEAESQDASGTEATDKRELSSSSRGSAKVPR